MRASTIERYKLYYFQPSYWRKLRRVCAYCGERYSKSNKVNFGFSFEQPKKYYHYDCQLIVINDRKQS